jgi:hypothetical protein
VKTIPILDQATYDKVVRVGILAKYQGRTLADVLNEQGLLWTPDRERQVRVATIRFILDEMNNWSPTEFLRRRKRGLESATPTDMYICINEWVQEHLAHAQIKPP